MIGRALLLAVLFVAAAGTARAQELDDTPPARPAPADTAFGGYLESLRDSTDLYFGRTVAPVDTAGLDSALAAGLARPPAEVRRFPRRLQFEFAPWLGFNRVDGPMYGGSGSVGRLRGGGQLFGRAGYAVGSDDWLGAGGYRKSFTTRDIEWSFSGEAGRATASLDRERSDLRLSSLRAFLWGNDSHRYLRRDGLDLQIEAEHYQRRGRIGYRHQIESPLEPTARWAAFRDHVTEPGNLAAAPGRNHELSYLAAARTPWVPFIAQAEHWTSSRRIGSDFDYRRTRLALGGDLAAGRVVTFVPQVAWGRLSGEALPQAAFYLGGSRTLRSMDGGERGGTGLAIARLDVLELPDLLEVMGIPHPAMLPIQAGAFLASGAVWGADPYGGPTRPGGDWPHGEDFVHEAGVSIIYRPGLPDPATMMQLSWAWPLGPNAGAPRFSVSYSRGLDLVRPLGRGGP